MSVVGLFRPTVITDVPENHFVVIHPLIEICGKEGNQNGLHDFNRTCGDGDDATRARSSV
jgi:hypothetical protein